MYLDYQFVHFCSRCKKGENFLDLACILKQKVYEICQQYFKYLKFVFGPPCPRKECPGATFHAENIQQPCESSSSESEESSQSSDDGGSGTEGKLSSEVVGATATSNQTELRRHVIHMNPDSFDPPYWCQEFDLSELLKDWDPSSSEEVRLLFKHKTLLFVPLSNYPHMHFTRVFKVLHVCIGV